MANPNQPDLFDNLDGSEHSNDDFEKLDPTNGFYNDTSRDQDGANAAGAGVFDSDQADQDTEISTTTDNTGEEEAEEDRYVVGASEADAYAHVADNLIDYGYGNQAFEPDEGEGQDDPFGIQPSAAVPVAENVEPLIDFNSSAGPDVPPSFPSSAYSYNSYEEQIPSSTSDPLRHFAVEEKETVAPEQSETKPESSVQSSEESASAAEGCWFKGLDPRVSDLIYWRDPKTTGVVFGGMLVMLISLAVFSFLSVVAYLALATLAVTFSYVTYKKIMAAVQKSGDGHPFKPFLELDIELREDKVKSAIQQILKNVNATTREVRRLFLIEDIVDSIKFGLLLWLLTYVGSWFNGMTLLIMGLVLVFTLPKVYETYQVQIDNYVGIAKGHVDNVLNIIQSKVPFLKKKEKPQ